MPLFSLIIYWHWFLKERTNRGHKSTEFTFVDSLLLKKKILSEDHNWETKGESKQWHERPAIVTSYLKSILVFVKHSPGPTLDEAIGSGISLRFLALKQNDKVHPPVHMTYEVCHQLRLQNNDNNKSKTVNLTLSG